MAFPHSQTRSWAPPPRPHKKLAHLLNSFLSSRPPPSARELDRQDRILDFAKTIMIRHGRAGLTIPGLANAMRMAAAAIRRHFPYIGSILPPIPYTNTCKTSRAPSVTRSPHANAGTSKGQMVRPY